MLVLVEGAAQAYLSAYVEMSDLCRIGDWFGQWVERSGVGDALMGPVGVVEAFVFSKGADRR